MAMALQSEVVNAPEKASRSLAHVLWSVASWARRRVTQAATLVQVTLSYVETGAGVGRRPAEWALATFRRWTGAETRAGWISVSGPVLEATWEALEWIRGRGLLHQPEVVPSRLEPAFSVDLPGGKLRGKARCGCPAHEHGDRDPSLLFDLHRGLATCAVSGEVFALTEGREGVVASRIVREIVEEEPSISPMITKDTPPGGGTREVTTGEDRGGEDRRSEERPGQSDRRGDAEAAGSPGPDPRCGGIATGRLWPSGLALALSRATSRESWAGWQERRWGGISGEGVAWEAMAYRERRGEPARGWMPERFVGVGWWRPSRVEWVEGPSGRRWPVMELEERGTGHVLLDLDDCPFLPGGAPEGMVEAIRGTLERRGLFGEVSWILRTSSHGVQIMVKLRRFRWDVVGFYRSAAVQRALREAGERVVKIVGGKVDPSAWAPRRMARAPGWRVKADPERASLWYLAGR